MVTHQVKVAVIGDGTVGKTSLVNSFSGKSSFMEEYLMTIGVNIVVHKMEINKDVKINFAIWDLGGQPRFNAVRPQFYKGAQLILYVYDISNRESFENLSKWLQEVNKSRGSPSSYKGFLVGNKLDLAEYRIIDFEAAKAFAEKMGFEAYIEISVKDGSGISKLTDMLADNIIKNASQKLVEKIELVS
ncbi:MAG: GTP-binding protein [Promethearchaeota archaeon]